MASMKERAVTAAKKYLEIQGYRDIEEFEGYVVGKDGRELVFCRVGVRSDGFDQLASKDLRKAAEQVSLHYLATSGACNIPIRFDDIQMVLVGADKAMLRHEKNCL